MSDSRTSLSKASDFELVDDDDSVISLDTAESALEPFGTEWDAVVDAPPFGEAHGALQIAAETFLQHGQPYPGDDHVQDEDRF